MSDEHINEARALVRDSMQIVALTGAGISAESGIPTFRGNGGLWRTHRAEDLATPEAFEHNPRLVWEWYDWRRGLVANARPNDGHSALARLEHDKGGFRIATQNVDGLHQRAGSQRVLELHGSLWTLRCNSCGDESIDHSAPLTPLPPRCPCGGLLRPGVVWFGEPLPTETFNAAMRHAADCDVMLVIGTSALVQPAMGIAHAALAAGRPVIEVNLEDTPFTSHATIALRGKSGEILPRIVR